MISIEDLYNLPHKDKLQLLFKQSHELQRKIAGIPSNDRLEYAIGVLTAQSLKAYSIWSICNPVPRPELLESVGVISDFSSGNVLLRSMYEAVLVSRYILLDDEFSKSRRIVVSVARLHGKREQYMLLKNMGSKRPEMANLEINLSRLKQFILDHNEFKYLPTFSQEYTRRSDIPNSKWHKKSTEQLAIRAGFHKTQHLQFYKYFSNYTHADPYAIDQISAVRQPAEAEEMTKQLYSHTENFLSVSLDIHLSVLNSENNDIPISREALEIIKLWKYIDSQDLAEEA